MSSTAVWVSGSTRNQGRAVLDKQSPLHFGVGLAAGYLNVDPHVAVLSFLAAQLVIVAFERGGLQEAAFHDHPQTQANHLGDLAMEILGYELGHWLHLRKAAVVPFPDPAPVPALPSPSTAGYFLPPQIRG